MYTSFDESSHQGETSSRTERLNETFCERILRDVIS